MTPSTQPFLFDYFDIVHHAPSVQLFSVSVEHADNQVFVTGYLTDGQTIDYSTPWPYPWSPELRSAIAQLFCEQAAELRDKLLTCYVNAANPAAQH